MNKYEHIAKFRNDKGERIKLVIKTDRAVVTFKSPLGAVYERAIERKDILKRKFDNESELYQDAIISVIRSLMDSLKFDFCDGDLCNEVYYCGVK